MYETGHSGTPLTALKPRDRHRSWIVESEWKKVGAIWGGPLNEWAFERRGPTRIGTAVQQASPTQARFPPMHHKHFLPARRES